MNSRALKWPVPPRWMLALVAVANAGCDRGPDNATPKRAPLGQSATVSVRVADADEYRATLEKLRGKVVLVDFWATWCPTCVEQFPHTVEMHRKYAERGLAVVSVSLDEPEAEPQVRTALSYFNANFDNLLSAYGGGVKAMEAFGLSGAIPSYRVYDRAGAVHRDFTIDPQAPRQATPADIEAAIVELLN
jgi:thiol-disulfide isomerase/thioredoxin